MATFRGLIKRGLNVWRPMSVIVAWLALTRITYMYGEPVFDKARCYQPHRHHLNLKWILMGGWTGAVFSVVCITNWYVTNDLISCVVMVNGMNNEFRETSYVSLILVGNKIINVQGWLEHRMSAQLQRHIHSRLNACLYWFWQRQLQDETRKI